MNKISILYPNKSNLAFNFQYYIDIHMPRSIQLLSIHPGFKGVSVERGVGTAEIGTEVPYIAMCHFTFDTIQNFIEAFTPHAMELQGDMKNFTDIIPIIQFNDILISQ
jgi:uncharacterized protein (TIGR02118 family)